jgi:hypothetical protein
VVATAGVNLLAQTNGTVRWVVGVILVAVVVLGVASFVRLGWRLLRGTDEFVAGGSWGKQMTTPSERKRRRRRAPRL